MIGRRLGCGRVSCIICLVLLCPLRGWSANLGDNIRTATNVGPFLNQITSYINERVWKLSGSDPVAQSSAREDLVSEVAPPAGGGKLSPAFQASYAGLLNDQLLKLSHSKDTRVRLNAAIVAAKVAEGAQNAALAPAVTALVSDPSDAVAWWALRAAKSVIPHDNGQLVLVIVQIGQTRPGVAHAAYDALAIAHAAIPGANTARVLSATTSAVHAILRSRIDQYKTGIPSDPLAESRAMSYLVGKKEYETQTAAQRLTTAQMISDLLSMAAKRAADVANDKRMELAIMIGKVGGAASVVGQREGNPTVEQLGGTINRLPRNATAEEMQAAVKPLFTALTGIEKFRKLTAPPEISEMADGSTMSGGSSAPTTTQSTAADGSR